MALNVDNVQKELGNYFRKNEKRVRAMVYGDGVQLNQYTTTITQVKGRIPTHHSVTDHVVQGFKDVWQKLGTTYFKVNELHAYHQKVNFPINPHKVEGTFLAEMNEINREMRRRSISEHIMDKELEPKVIDDLNYLSGEGVYDANKADGQFGYSMDGLKEILKNGINNNKNPMYKVPINAITDSNAVEQVKKFEESIPRKLLRTTGPIFMGDDKKNMYKWDVTNTFGNVNWFGEENTMRSILRNKPIVGLEALNGSDYMFTTPPDNFLKLIDVFNLPNVTDIQKHDYILKIFMDFFLGYGFWTNPLVVVADSGITESGMLSGSSGQNWQNIYYSE